jgi:co-chaperonin GroES (HSP10)
MRSYDSFVVYLPKRVNDTISLSNGLELYVDTRFNEFEYRVNEGEVISVPFKYDTPVQVGDTLYFHHLVVMNDGQVLADLKDHYLVKFSPSIATNNQAIGYKSKDTGLFHTLNKWSVLAPYEEPKVKMSEIIEVVEFNEPPVTKGVVAFDSEELAEIGVKKGDVVGFKKNHDYRFKIDGIEYYRTRVEDLMYVQTEEL